MSEQNHPRATHPLNANLVMFIIVINFVVIGGLILANTPALSPQLNGGAELVAALATPSVTPPPSTVMQEEASTLTATRLPPTLTPSPAEPPAAESAAAGDAANGQVLFNTFQAAASFACSTCHYADREDQLIGPGLLNVSVRAEARVPGMSVVDYLHTSIVDPGAFVVPNFPDGLMPRNWAEVYSEQEIDNLIAYLMTLREE